MMATNIVHILRAKSKDEKNYLLKDHLKDTILRAIQLKEFINQNKSAIQYRFEDDFFQKLVIACFLHDLGKINWKFQCKLFDKNEKEYDEKNRRYKNDEFHQLHEFFKDKDSKKIDVKDHEVVSLIYSLIFLGNDVWDKKIRTAILLHHYNEFYINRDSANIRYVFDEYHPHLEKYVEFLIKKEEEIKGLLEALLQNLLNSVVDQSAQNVLEKLKNNLNFNKLKEFKECIKNDCDLSIKLQLFNIPDKEDEKFYDFFVFLGCLRRCDYSASGDVKIEEIQNLGLGEVVYKNLDERIKKKVERKEIWQEKILEQNDSDNLVLIAPTGSGKTEFALLWAKNRGKKLIYALPLRVALNDLYWRFGDKYRGYFNREFLRILHSTSFIEYLKEEKDGEKLDIDEKQTTAELFSSPLSLTTPDQVFLSSLKYYGFDKLVSIYPTSAIVIDEIQAYNPEMAAVIIKTLEIIKKLYGNLLIITATFPPYFEKFVGKEKGFTIIDLENSKIKDQIKNYNLKRHKIEIVGSQSIFEYKDKEQKKEGLKLEINEKSFNEIENKIKIKENETKNILIILNNVGKAIELYKKLEEKLGKLKIKKENLYLLHSRLLEKEKAGRINEIKEKLKNKERIILVATQIVEASVDVDFDILITEISPIDSQIQRWGRVYRNRSANYSDSLPNIFIFESRDKGTFAIYDRRVIETTIKVLEKYQNQVLDYEKERKIIKDVFDSEIENQTLKDVFVDEINKNLDWLKYYSAEKRSETQQIFRRIAGVQIVIPRIMEKENDETSKSFAEIINNPENKNISWETILKKIKEKTNKDTNVWSLKKILYDNSTNLPMFYFEKLRRQVREFKGFYVLKLPDEKVEECIKFGIDSLRDDIDNEEIKQYEDNII